MITGLAVIRERKGRDEEGRVWYVCKLYRRVSIGKFHVHTLTIDKAAAMLFGPDDAKAAIKDIGPRKYVMENA